jgi:L-lactate permease
MKTELKKPEMTLMAIGLLLVCAIQFIARKMDVPDFIQGTVIGAGIGLELLALIRLAKRRRASNKA